MRCKMLVLKRRTVGKNRKSAHAGMVTPPVSSIPVTQKTYAEKLVNRPIFPALNRKHLHPAFDADHYPPKCHNGSRSEIFRLRHFVADHFTGFLVTKIVIPSTRRKSIIPA